MTLNEYQLRASRTLGGKTDLVMGALGLVGEAGEVADLIKKVAYHGHELDERALIKELGDVLWYIAAIASMRGIPLSAVAEANLAKLAKRYPDGFSEEASRKRGE